MYCDVVVIGCVADDASDFPTAFHVHHRVAAIILGVVRGSCCVEVRCSCFGCFKYAFDAAKQVLKGEECFCCSCVGYHD